MDLKEFGRRMQIVREELLRMNQTEIAWNLHMSQTMYSRLESGIAGNIHTVFRVVSFLRYRKLQAHMMFAEEFDLQALVHVPAPPESSELRILEYLDQLKDSAKEDYEKLTILREMVSSSQP